MNENPQVIVVGGGASGLTAAIVAAQNGATGNCTKRFKTVFHGRYTGVFWTDGCGFY